MDNNKLDSIKKIPLDKKENPKGKIFHVIKNSSKHYKSFGEAYFSFIKFRQIKGWKYHKKMNMNLVSPIGSVLFVFYCEKNKVFRKEIIGKNNYFRLYVPSKVWFAFQGLGKQTNIILNIASIKHSPNEQKNCLLKDIPFKWKR